MASSLLQHDGGVLLRDRSQCIATRGPVSFRRTDDACCPATHRRWRNAVVDAFSPVGLPCLVPQALARATTMWRLRPAADDGWTAAATSPWDEARWGVRRIRWYGRANDPMASPVFRWNAPRYVSIRVPAAPSDSFHVRRLAHVTRDGISVRKEARQ